MGSTSVTGTGQGEAGRKPMYSATSAPESLTAYLYGQGADVQIMKAAPAGGGGGCSLPNTVYVALSGNDTSGDGTSCKPYATIGKALASITDNSDAKRYVIQVQPGNYVEPGWLLKPFVFIVGCARGNCFISTTSNIGLDPSFGNAWSAKARSGIKGFAIRGAFASPNFNLQAVGSSANGAAIFILECSINDVLIARCRNVNDYIEVIDSYLFNGLDGTGGNGYVENTYITGNVNVDNTNVTDFTQWEFYGAWYPAGNLTFTNVNSSFAELRTVGGAIWGNLTVTGTPNTYFEADHIPTVGFFNIGPNVSFRRLTDAYSYAYTPAVPANWTVQPTTIQQALDMIAAKVGPV